jgi:hypothetical protein
MKKRSTLEQAWRDRLAVKIRRFKKAKGRWPVSGTVPALKRAIAQAIAQGMKVPWEH